MLFTKRNDPSLYHNLRYIVTLADQFLCGYAHNKDMTEFFKITQINEKEYLKFCREFIFFYINKYDIDEESSPLEASDSIIDILNVMDKRLKEYNEEETVGTLEGIKVFGKTVSLKQNNRN